MKHSALMLKKSENSYTQSNLALQAELTTKPFYDFTMHYKMSLTVLSHIARLIVNIGLMFYSIFNTLALSCTEDNSKKALTRGAYTVANFACAAGFDAINIFATMGAIVVRSLNSLLSGYQKDDYKATTNLVDKFFTAVETPLQKVGSYIEYLAASSLNFSPTYNP